MRASSASGEGRLIRTQHASFLSPQEEIEWEVEKELQPRMSYVKRPVMLKRETTFLAWKAASQARQD